VTTPAEPARPRLLLDVATELEQLRKHRQLLERQQLHQSTGPIHQLMETAREIQDTKVVERWLARQLRNTGGH
jgi:hypothetical protein